MNTPALSANDFPAFFRELWANEPFPWQADFASRIVDGAWPKYVAVPTGSGKTACLDAAVFALAAQSHLPPESRTVGRRIFFIVNRRIIVDEAYYRAGQLCQALVDAAPDSVIGRVAAALRSLSGREDARPLARTQLRGGIYRDRSWVASLLQPMIVCSTVDQAGSRLLFRGYGVTETAQPIHAALVAQDSVIILDEAHISLPFTETLEWVSRYRTHQPNGAKTIALPFQFVQMTATPPAGTSEAEKVTLTTADHSHPILGPRLSGAKPARLCVEDDAKGKKRDEQMAKRLVEEATSLLAEHLPRSLAIMVNRVVTARSIYKKLKEAGHADVALLIGRLRPLDRDALTRALQSQLKTNARPEPASESGPPQIVVSTQCLEVGADLDFDALVTEAASLDALRQRFGRLNRAGRPITPQSRIVLPGDQDVAIAQLDKSNPIDPIYGNAIAHTWHWLQGIAQDGVVDFGILSMGGLLQTLIESQGPDVLSQLLSPTSHAPVLLPAYLDCWAQTSPSPAADPDVALFLHGPQRDVREIQVCWRGDLPANLDINDWCDILSLCPPTSAECLAVPMHTFREWLKSGDRFVDESSDVGEETQAFQLGADELALAVPALIWRGPEASRELRKNADLSPGDTVVLRAQDGGWDALGLIATTRVERNDNPLESAAFSGIDLAEVGMARTRRKAILRIHPALRLTPPGTPAADLIELATDTERDWRVSDVQALIKEMQSSESPGWTLGEHEKSILTHLAKERILVDRYPNNCGIVIRSHRLLPQHDAFDFENDESDDDALLQSNEPLALASHTRDVVSNLKNALEHLPLAPYQQALLRSAELHDWGKADYRFQAMLRGSTLFAALASDVVLAKSGTLASSAAARRENRRRAALPEGFRHEMLSVQMAQTDEGKAHLPEEPLLSDLALHLIATHHGYGRPFAPVVEDADPPDAELIVGNQTLCISKDERTQLPAHALESGIADRFWLLLRHHGWWGLAYLETALRLADQQASASPSGH